MAQYTGSFYSTDTNTKYDVSILGAAQNRNIIFGLSPLTVEYNGSTDIHQPSVRSLATVKFITDRIHTDLMAENPLSNQIFVRQGGNVLWFGYLVPQIYSAPYNDLVDELEINAEDVLGVMGRYVYREFVEQFVHGTAEGETKPFIYILRRLLRHFGGNQIKYIYESTNLKATSGAAETTGMLESIFINDTLFYENDRTCLDIVEAMAKYLNMTAIQIGDGLFFTDYDSQTNKYRKYTVSDDSAATLDYTHARTTRLIQNVISGHNTAISTLEVSKSVIFTSNYDDTYDMTERLTDEEYTKYVQMTTPTEVIRHDGNDWYFRRNFIDSSYGYGIYYDTSRRAATTRPADLAAFDGPITGGILLETSAQKNSFPDTSTLTDRMILCKTADINTDTQRTCYVIEDRNVQNYGGSDVYGELAFLDITFERLNTPWMALDASGDPDSKYRSVDSKYRSVPVKISITDGSTGSSRLYYDGSNNRWVSTETITRIPLKIEDGTKLYYEWTGVDGNKNLVGAPTAVEHSGYLVQLTDPYLQGYLKNGRLRFELLIDGMGGQSDGIQYQYFKNISIKGTGQASKGASVEFSGDSSFYGANDYEDDNFISTFAGTDSHSNNTTMVVSGSHMKNLRGLWRVSDSSLAMPEEFRTAAMTKQYCQRRIVIDTDVKNGWKPYDRFEWNMVDGTYYPVAATIDYYYGKSRVKLVEYKTE